MSANYNRILPCHKYLKKGFKYGKDGVCHLYTDGDEKSMNNALKKAMNDGQHIEELKAKAQKRNPLRLFFEL